MRRMSVYITTALKIRGQAWAARYPEQVDDLYVVVQAGTKRKRKRIGPPTEENRARADRLVAEYRAVLERQELRDAGMAPMTFADAADSWLLSGLRKRAPKTVEGRTYQVDRLKASFGREQIASITAERIVEWWDAEIEQSRSARTGRGYLNVLSLIFKYAGKMGPIENPVPRARELIFSEVEMTAMSRAANEKNLNPLTADEMAKLLPAVADQRNPDLLITVLLMYECGLRLGEATGLQWGDFWPGRDADDVSRHISVQRARTNGRTGHTKSGRGRKVAISRRLRGLLLERQMELGRPSRTGWIVEQNWGTNIRQRLERACKAARIDRHLPKDFRDTYASTLITHGIVLKWVSLQLGHASIAVTEGHYASYMATDRYQNPWQVLAGCLPPDLFVGLDGWRTDIPQAHVEDWRPA